MAGGGGGSSVLSRALRARNLQGRGRRAPDLISGSAQHRGDEVSIDLEAATRHGGRTSRKKHICTVRTYG
jgi:hypothetical protein